MKIITVESGPILTNGYLVYDESNQNGIIIDVPLESYLIFKSLIEEKKLKIDAIILTHSHWDHTADAAQLKSFTSAPLYVHPQDEYRLKEPNKHTIFNLPFNIDSVKVDVAVSHRTHLQFGMLEFEIRHTPGHTEGGICIINHINKIVFSGDTLFSGSIGRVDLPGGSFEQLISSITNEILTLDDDYKIYSGHGDPTDIRTERRANPFLSNSNIL